MDVKEISCYDKKTKRSEAKEGYSEEIPEDDGSEHSYFFLSSRCLFSEQPSCPEADEM